MLAILYFVTALGSALAWDWYSFLAFRFFGGLAVGGASVVSPLYIAEISPAQFRGRLVAIQQFNVVLGILLAFLSNYLIARMNLGRVGMAVDARRPGRRRRPLFFFLLFPTPESPRWLDRPGPGRRGPGRPGELGRRSRAASTRRSPRSRPRSTRSTTGRATRCSGRAYRRPILLAVAIATFNQLSGINAILYYAPADLQDGRRASRLGAAPGGGRGRDEPGLHDAGDDASSTTSAAAG